MLEKIIESLTGINPRVIISIIIIGVCIVSYVYVNNLRTTIIEQSQQISTLRFKLESQNKSVEQLSKDSMALETRLNNVKISNGRLSNENSRLNEFIDKQQPAKNCDEAFSRITNNAEQIAKAWNNK